MADPSADSPFRGEGGDRRKLVDLIRAERGEPERRRLPRFGDPVLLGDQESPAEGEPGEPGGRD